MEPRAIQPERCDVYHYRLKGLHSANNFGKTLVDACNLHQGNPEVERISIVTIWVNEQIDPCGIIRACIACRDEAQAQECHNSFETNLTPEQKQQGWIAQIRQVETWEEVPVNALKLD